MSLNHFGMEVVFDVESLFCLASLLGRLADFCLGGAFCFGFMVACIGYRNYQRDYTSLKDRVGAPCSLLAFWLALK